ncbi:unnamed protein product [Rotaria sp. Silwood2]|nr:unnamed protein product [Rotaria sp. Silwood2]
MLIAKYSGCKTKTELQACEVCEEAKCVKCAQQHLTELKSKWKAIESKVNDITSTKNKKQLLLVSIQQTVENQLSILEQVYNRILEKLKQEYEEYHKQLSTSKIQYNNKLAELDKRYNELQNNELFQKWITITDESVYYITK